MLSITKPEIMQSTISKFQDKAKQMYAYNFYHNLMQCSSPHHRSAKQFKLELQALTAIVYRAW